MISLRKRFLFIHVPKTGGNSIQNILRDYSEDKIVTLSKHQDGIERFELRNNIYDIKKHSTLKHYSEVLEQRLFKQLFKFATIRNPWDMCISFYFSPNRGKTEWDRDDFKGFIQNIPTIRNYIALESTINKSNGKTQKGLNDNVRPIDCDIDFLIRFEKLNEDFKKVCELIEIPYVKLPHRNKSTREHYTKYYDEELIELVRHRFSDEISYASYTFGGC